MRLALNKILVQHNVGGADVEAHESEKDRDDVGYSTHKWMFQVRRT